MIMISMPLPPSKNLELRPVPTRLKALYLHKDYSRERKVDPRFDVGAFLRGRCSACHLSMLPITISKLSSGVFLGNATNHGQE